MERDEERGKERWETEKEETVRAIMMDLQDCVIVPFLWMEGVNERNRTDGLESIEIRGPFLKFA